MKSTSNLPALVPERINSTNSGPTALNSRGLRTRSSQLFWNGALLVRLGLIFLSVGISAIQEMAIAQNTAPTISTIGSQQTTSEDTSKQINFTVADDGPLGNLILTGQSPNPTLVPNASIYFSGTGANRTVTIWPSGNQFGQVLITITVRDAQGLSASTSFNLNVTSVNDPPTLNSIAPVSVSRNAGTQTVSLTGIGSGAANETQTLSVLISNSNPSLIPNPTLSYTSPSSTGSLSFAPAANVGGQATITVLVHDGASQNANITRNLVVTVNNPPTIYSLANSTIPRNAGTQTVQLVGITAGASESQTLTVTATSNNTGLIPHPTVSYLSPNSTGTMTYAPVLNNTGAARITVLVTDSLGGQTTAAFDVTVTAVNNPPTINSISSILIPQNAGTQTVPLNGISAGANESQQTVTITAMSNKAGFIPNPTVSHTNPSSTGTLSFTPTSNMSDNATITVRVTDSLGSYVEKSFVVTVNSRPTIIGISNQFTCPGTTQIGPLAFTIGDVETPADNLLVSVSTSDGSLIPHSNITLGGSGPYRTITLLPAQNVTGTCSITLGIEDGVNTARTTSFSVEWRRSGEFWVNSDTTGTVPAGSYLGSGTQADPWRVADASGFDGRMRFICPNSTIHLGSGTFFTRGGIPEPDYFRCTSPTDATCCFNSSSPDMHCGFHIKSGWRITGSGNSFDPPGTIVQLVHAPMAGAIANGESIKHGFNYVLSSPVDFNAYHGTAQEVSGVTVENFAIDCNYPSLITANIPSFYPAQAIADLRFAGKYGPYLHIGAIQLFGHHNTIRNVAVRNAAANRTANGNPSPEASWQELFVVLLGSNETSSHNDVIGCKLTNFFSSRAGQTDPRIPGLTAPLPANGALIDGIGLNAGGDFPNTTSHFTHGRIVNCTVDQEYNPNPGFGIVLANVRQPQNEPQKPEIKNCTIKNCSIGINIDTGHSRNVQITDNTFHLYANQWGAALLASLEFSSVLRNNFFLYGSESIGIAAFGPQHFCSACPTAPSPPFVGVKDSSLSNNYFYKLSNGNVVAHALYLMGVRSDSCWTCFPTGLLCEDNWVTKGLLVYVRADWANNGHSFARSIWSDGTSLPYYAEGFKPQTKLGAFVNKKPGEGSNPCGGVACCSPTAPCPESGL